MARNYLKQDEIRNNYKEDWLCNWGKMTKEDIQNIHNHFGILNI